MKNIKLINLIAVSNDVALCEEASDGYHTFDELYEHRCLLFVSLLAMRRLLGYAVYKSAPENGWFVAGTLSPEGQIGYHLPEHMFSLVESNYEAPGWDGHTSDDALKRLVSLIQEGHEYYERVNQ